MLWMLVILIITFEFIIFYIKPNQQNLMQVELLRAQFYGCLSQWLLNLPWKICLQMLHFLYWHGTYQIGVYYWESLSLGIFLYIFKGYVEKYKIILAYIYINFVFLMLIRIIFITFISNLFFLQKLIKFGLSKK